MSDGRLVTKVVDADGADIQLTYAAPRITVSFERKIAEAHGLPQYESASAYAAVQADVALDGSDRTSALTEAFQLAKGAVLKQLSLDSTTDDEGVIIEKLVSTFNATPAKAPARGATGNAAPKGDAASLWRELESDPGKFFDNRADKASGKANAKGPDFKRKGTGEGLWITNKDGSSNAEQYGVTLP